jgi:hypothetical protein
MLKRTHRGFDAAMIEENSLSGDMDERLLGHAVKSAKKTSL